MVAKYDKAASQHAAAREMITVAEEKLGTKIVNGTYATGSNPSALDLAWQEMLNHATTKVGRFQSLCSQPCMARDAQSRHCQGG